MNEDVFSILQSPDDRTPIRADLVSEGGIRYELTESGILVLCPGIQRLSDTVYSSPMFSRWDSIVDERMRYYTGKKSVAGLLANWSYRSMRSFNRRPEGEWLLDIGCGDGAHLVHLRDRSTYIGLDRSMKRLELLKRSYPEATAIYGDAASLPFRSGSLNYVFSCNAFEHIWYLKDAVLELYRCTGSRASLTIVVPTEGGLWNLGRRLVSRPRFRRRHPDIDFDFISRVEHSNEARQVAHAFEMFFVVEKKYRPTRIPSVMLNVFIDLQCRRRGNGNLLSHQAIDHSSAGAA